jgi:hypothetical protein
MGGAAIGAGAGFLLGKLFQYDRRRAYYDEYDGRYPVARRSRTWIRHQPLLALTTRLMFADFPHGARVIDPSNERNLYQPVGAKPDCLPA